MNDRELKSIIESILFVWSEPIHVDELNKILEIDKKTILKLLNEMQDEFQHFRRGIVLEIRDNYVQFVTRKEHYDILSKLLKTSKRRISNSAMEVLAIIAYKQPITRIEIDNIRGVKSYSSIETLKNKNLITEVGKSDSLGKPILYGTTNQFLSSFDINSLRDLPDIDNLSVLDNIMKDEEDEN